MLDAFKTNGSSPPVDLIVHGGGTVCVLRPTSPTGDAWIEEHIEPGALWFGGGVVVEHRYIRDIVVGAISDGLTVQ